MENQGNPAKTVEFCLISQYNKQYAGTVIRCNMIVNKGGVPVEI